MKGKHSSILFSVLAILYCYCNSSPLDPRQHDKRRLSYHRFTLSSADVEKWESSDKEWNLLYFLLRSLRVYSRALAVEKSIDIDSIDFESN